MSGLAGPLENGLPGNILGGLGSGLAYAGGTTFVAVPDRGPNATAYNSRVDDTSSYIARFHTLDTALTASAPGSPTPFTLTPTLTGTTLLYSGAPLIYGTGAGLNNNDGTALGSGMPAQNRAGVSYFTGRSDNFGPGPSNNPANGRFDPEGVRVSNDGRSVFVSDEYGPYVYQFDRATGERTRTFTLPPKFAVANQSPNGATEINPANNTGGRTANRGMEGLAITPDGTTLVGIMQSALIQDGAVPASSRLARIVTIDIATGATKEYGYLLTTGTGVSEIVALNATEFLVDERDGRGLGDGTTARVKDIFKINLTGAADISSLGGAAAAAAAVPKTSFLNLVALLGANGISAANVPSKIEGLAIGADVSLNGAALHTLWISNDNDFVPDVAGPNVLYVVGFSDADLAGTLLVPQAFAAQPVPEPAALALLATGLLAMAGVRRR